MVYGVQNNVSAAASFNSTAPPQTTQINGSARAVRQTLMAAVMASAFAKIPNKTHTQANSSAALSGGASSGSLQSRAQRSVSGPLQHLVTTRPRTRESANTAAASGFNKHHKFDANDSKKINASLRASDFLKKTSKEASEVAVKTKETKEKCGSRTTALALVEVGGLSKESNKTKERAVLQRFAACFTQPYRQSVATAYPETYQACVDLGLQDYFGFIPESVTSKKAANFQPESRQYFQNTL